MANDRRERNPAATRCLEWGPVLLHASGDDASRGVRTEDLALVGARGIPGGWAQWAAAGEGEGMGTGGETPAVLRVARLRRCSVCLLAFVTCSERCGIYIFS